MYSQIKQGPRTAQALAEGFDLDMDTTLDFLRILENFNVIEHRADPLGVIRWQPRPGNPWNLGPTPF